MRLERLREIVSLLREKKAVTAPELAERFHVSRRTINRDIDDLCRAGLPIVTVRGHGGGIALAEEAEGAADGYVARQSLLAVFEGSERERLERDALRYFELNDGTLLLTREFARYEEMRNWVSSFGDRVRVLEPDALREDLCRQAQNILSAYRSA